MLWAAGLLLAGLSAADRAAAQYPPAMYGGYGYPGGYGGLGGTGYAGQGAPFTRMNQPLSPYLNLNLGRSRAVNYYSGVRPLLNAAGPFGQRLAPFGATPPTYFPNAVTAEDLEQPPVESGSPAPPTGHFTAFSPFPGASPAFSTFGAPSYYGNTFSGLGRRQQQAQPSQPGTKKPTGK
jgi:hypothetical protein